MVRNPIAIVKNPTVRTPVETRGSFDMTTATRRKLEGIKTAPTSLRGTARILEGLAITADG